MSFATWMRSLSCKERLRIADEKTQKLALQTADLFYYHAANRVISYSDTLWPQIPQSLAGNAFKVLQRGMLEAEIMRLARLWDKPDQYSTSIPTVWELVKEPYVQSEFKRAHFDFGYYGNNMRILDFRWSRLNRVMKRDGRHPLKESVVNYRNKIIAHSLDRTIAEVKGLKIKKLRYGDERRLLYRTVAVVRLLEASVCRSHRSWSEACSNAHDANEALWKGCTFQVIE